MEAAETDKIWISLPNAKYTWFLSNPQRSKISWIKLQKYQKDFEKRKTWQLNFLAAVTFIFSYSSDVPAQKWKFASFLHFHSISQATCKYEFCSIFLFQSIFMIHLIYLQTSKFDLWASNTRLICLFVYLFVFLFEQFLIEWLWNILLESMQIQSMHLCGWR